MTPWIKNPLQNNQQKKSVPSDEDYEMIIRETLSDMNCVWMNFYKKYAYYCGSEYEEFDFPHVDDIFTQFKDFLKHNRHPERPKKTNEIAPYTYGDWKRSKSHSGAYIHNISNNKSLDNGWGDDNNSQLKQSNDNDGWGDDDKIEEPIAKRQRSFDDRLGGDGGFRGGRKNFRGRGNYQGRSRGRGRNNYQDNSRQFGGNKKKSFETNAGNTGWSDDEKDSAPKASEKQNTKFNDSGHSGWSDNEDDASKSINKNSNWNNSAINDDDGWNDNPVVQPTVQQQNTINAAQDDDESWE